MIRIYIDGFASPSWTEALCRSSAGRSSSPAMAVRSFALTWPTARSTHSGWPNRSPMVLRAFVAMPCCRCSHLPSNAIRPRCSLCPIRNSKRCACLRQARMWAAVTATSQKCGVFAVWSFPRLSTCWCWPDFRATSWRCGIGVRRRCWGYRKREF